MFATKATNSSVLHHILEFNAGNARLNAFDDNNNY